MCDTVVATGEATLDGSVILAKNSDREPNEVQLLHHVPARSFSTLRSYSGTYLKIPQSARTAEVLLSRPAWMWGCEMGANAAGLTIGNEAVFTREPYSKTGLTGMDLLRLALERPPGHRMRWRSSRSLSGVTARGGIAGIRASSIITTRSSSPTKRRPGFLKRRESTGRPKRYAAYGAFPTA